MAAPPAWGTAQPGASAAPAAKKTSVLGGLLALVGSALAIFGVFSGWVTLDPGTNSETVTGWSLTVGDGLLKSSDPYLIVGFAVVGLVIAVALFTGIARPLARIAALLVGIGIVVVAALNWMAIASFVTDNLPSSFEATTAIGFYLAIGGGVLVAVSALMPAKK